jgi:hypothetical protein
MRNEEISSMQSRTCILSAFTLSTAMAIGAAMAADMPKEGTYNADYTAFGAAKSTAIGKERVLIAFDENGLWLSKGFADHMTWHCFGLIDILSGMEQFHGYCVGLDPSGDQLVNDIADNGKFPADAKSFSGKVTITTGTGKYPGLAVVGHLHVTRQSSERQQTEPSPITAPIQAPTNCRDVWNISLLKGRRRT